jgi:tripartite-type tricarboxylate transporter receptor subunit TctC
MVAASMLCPVPARAQTYPSRAIVMVVPFAAGGTFDVMGRIIAVRMSETPGPADRGREHHRRRRHHRRAPAS